MAVRYVKDFEFPAAAGYTKSCETSPAKMAKQPMYAKGGSVAKPAAKAPMGKAPKGGLMVIIGVGAPKKPMKKADGGAISDSDARMLRAMAEEADATTEAERIMGRGQGSITDSEARAMQAAKKKPAPKKTSPYVPGTNIPARGTYSEEDLARLERGYAKGGMTKAQKKIGKVMGEYKAGELHSGSKKGPVVKNPKQAIAIALSEAGKTKKAAGGGIKYIDKGKDTSVSVKDIKSGKVKQSHDRDYYREVEQSKKAPAMKKGGKVSHMEWEHSKEDLAQDRKLAKKHGMSFEAWEKSKLDEKHDKQQSTKGLKRGGKVKTKYADGGPVAAGAMAYDPRLAAMSDAQRNRAMSRMGNVASDALTTPTTGGPLPPVNPNMMLPGRGGSPAPGGTMGPRPMTPVGTGGPSLPAPRGMGRPPGLAMKSGGSVKSPLQSMKIGARTPSMDRPKSVPVASRAPLIQSPSMEAASPPAARMGVGINESRPGKPDVGRIRAMMAKAASAAKPENSPAVMKRGGMTKGKC